MNERFEQAAEAFSHKAIAEVRFQTYYFTMGQVWQAFPAAFEQVELGSLSMMVLRLTSYFSWLLINSVGKLPQNGDCMATVMNK